MFTKFYLPLSSAHYSSKLSFFSLPFSPECKATPTGPANTEWTSTFRPILAPSITTSFFEFFRILRSPIDSTNRWSVWVSVEQNSREWPGHLVNHQWWFFRSLDTNGPLILIEGRHSGLASPTFEFGLSIFSNYFSNSTLSLHRLAKSPADVRAGGVQRPLRCAIVLSSAVLSHRASGSSRGRLLGGSAPDQPQFLLLLKLRARPERGAVVCESGGRLRYQVSRQRVAKVSG